MKTRTDHLQLQVKRDFSLHFNCLRMKGIDRGATEYVKQSIETSFLQSQMVIRKPQITANRDRIGAVSQGTTLLST